MTTLLRETRALGAAFTFLTRIPLGGLASHDPADLPASAAYFPVVGLAVGAIGGIAYWATAAIWPASVALILATCATVIATGAFHEDALADALDGFGGGWSRDQILAIMKDSRVGSYALVGVTLVVGLKLAALFAITTRDATAGNVVSALIAAHTLARWSSLPLIWQYPYVRPTGDGDRASAGRPFVAGVSTARFAAATAITVSIVGLMEPERAIACVVTTIVVSALAGLYFRHRIGGITGDALGAANQIVEVCVYLTLAARPLW